MVFSYSSAQNPPKIAPIIEAAASQIIPQSTTLTMEITSPAIASPLQELYFARSPIATELNTSAAIETMQKYTPSQSESRDTTNPAIPIPLTFFLGGATYMGAGGGVC